MKTYYVNGFPKWVFDEAYDAFCAGRFSSYRPQHRPEFPPLRYRVNERLAWVNFVHWCETVFDLLGELAGSEVAASFLESVGSFTSRQRLARLTVQEVQILDVMRQHFAAELREGVERKNQRLAVEYQERQAEILRHCMASRMGELHEPETPFF